MNIRLRYWLILSSVLFCQLTIGQDSGQLSQCPLVKVDVERLPDLNIPRNGHSAICINGEVTVFGGHTTNFIPTPTAEYYKDGEWHPVEMAYPHDNGLCVVLRSGKVLLAGGHAEPMGVGQSCPVEEYDPGTHTFRGFCILSMKRTFASGAELDNGRVVVSGNWYADDGIELFDGERNFSPVKGVTMGRAVPCLLRTSDGDILILGNESPYGKPLLSDQVDRLKGDPLRVPILYRWQPIIFEAPFPNDISFIGDESKNDYTYLLAMQGWSEKDTTTWNVFGRQLGFVLVRDTTFSLLPTTCPVPQVGFSPSDSIIWYSPLIADRKACRGYVHGVDLQGRSYVLCAEYDKRPAPLTLYYTDVLPDAGSPMIVLTDDGDLMMVGGHNFNKRHGGQLENDNFSPLASVYLLHLGTRTTATSAASAHGRFWWIALALVAVFVIVMLLLRKRRVVTTKSEDHDSEQNHSICPTDSAASDSDEQLMQRICDLMEQQQPYLQSDLKLNDVAAMLNTNRNIVSNCINSQRACSFSQFVGTYRVEYAKQLMRRQKDVKIAEVWMQSGFTNETSFFRTFKSVTGLTPNEWKAKE